MKCDPSVKSKKSYMIVVDNLIEAEKFPNDT